MITITELQKMARRGQMTWRDTADTFERMPNESREYWRGYNRGLVDGVKMVARKLKLHVPRHFAFWFKKAPPNS